MKQVLCSTGALIGMPNGRNHRLIENFASKLTCDGFEFMMYSSWYEKVDELVSDLLKMQLYIPVMHCEKHIGEAISRNEQSDLEHALRLFETNCEIANALGASKMVIHLWDGMTSDQNFQNNLHAYEKLLKISSKHGIDLMVENVVCNKENPLKHWTELTALYPHIHFILDTKMAAFHFQLEEVYTDEYRWLWNDHHIKHLHINDYAGGYMDWANLKTLPIGKGHIHFDTFFDFLKTQDYDGDFTVEATAFDKSGAVDCDMLNNCFSYIRNRL